MTGAPAPSRRRVLMGLLGVGGALAAGGFGPAFGRTLPFTDDVPGVLHLAATAELLAVTFYHAALSGASFRISDAQRGQLTGVLAAERGHLGALRRLGGRPLNGSLYLPADLLADAGRFVETGLHLETTFTSAYLAATHQFAERGEPGLAATAAQLGASEAQHLTLLSSLAGLGPGDVTLPTPSFRRVAEAAPVLAPYLEGGAGFTAFAAPTERELRALLGERGQFLSRTFEQAFGTGRKSV